MFPPIENIRIITKRYDDILLKAYYPKYLAYDPNLEVKPNEHYPTIPGHLRWMLSEISKGEMAVDKLHRWLGYVQGVMVSQNLIEVHVERDFTRPLLTKDTNSVS